MSVNHSEQTTSTRDVSVLFVVTSCHDASAWIVQGSWDLSPVRLIDAPRSPMAPQSIGSSLAKRVLMRMPSGLPVRWRMSPVVGSMPTLNCQVPSARS